MPTHEVKSIIDGEPTFEKPLPEILAELKLGGALKTMTPFEYITNQQIAWWKGILLPALARDSGDSISYWEAKLKIAVMPKEFEPYYVPLGRQVFPIIPSITKLSKKKMNVLIEGSVDKCQEWGFVWVTLPDKEKRKLFGIKKDLRSF